jgi:electron transfer flavoprotein alpha subunit
VRKRYFRRRIDLEGDNKMEEEKRILVYCEGDNGKLSSIALELLGVARRLAGELGQSIVSAVLIGEKSSSLAQKAIEYGADKVYIVEDNSLKDYITDSYIKVMEKVISEVSPQIILLGQTQNGRDLAPRLAFRLNTAATLDCIALSIDPITRRMLTTKPIYGGNAQVVQLSEADPQIATIRSKALSPSDIDTNRQGKVIRLEVRTDPATIRTRVLERKVEEVTGIKLEEARVVVVGGRGIGGSEGFKQLEELANVMKGAVGASRPPCDNKWVSDSLQIGLTGKIVSPEVYIAVALSGSSQHLSGCSGAKVIVAINKDAEANIFKVAHYGVVGDWKKILPAFTNEVKKLIC